MCNIPDYIHFPTIGNSDFDFYTYDSPNFYRYNNGMLEKYSRFLKKFVKVPNHLINRIVNQKRWDKEEFMEHFCIAILER